MDGLASSSTGGGANNQGLAHTAAGRLASPLIADRLRLVVEGANVRANPPEGAAIRNSVGGGLRYEGPDVQATVRALANFGTLERVSAGGTLAWQPDDRWSFALDGEYFSLETPLRALLYGITANSLGASAAWRRDEGLRIGTLLGWMDFSDGNTRWAGGLNLQAGLVAQPHFRLTGLADLYSSTNSQPGGPYFAPSFDLSLSLGFEAQHIAWRRYERILTQVLMVNAGPYWQRDYGGTWIGTLAYEHRWRRDPWRELFYGVTLTRRVYDGDPERTVAAVAGLRQAF